MMKHVGEEGKARGAPESPPQGTLNTHEPAVCIQGFRGKLGSTQETEPADS